MKIDISFKDLYNNRAIIDYFFREQSDKTLSELISRSSEEISLVLDAIDVYAYIHGLDVDDIEEMFYNELVEYIAIELGIELKEEEEE